MFIEFFVAADFLLATVGCLGVGRISRTPINKILQKLITGRIYTAWAGTHCLLLSSAASSCAVLTVILLQTQKR